MKYNKIAMLVAGGLMVGASGSVFAVDLAAVTADIPEFGTLTGLDSTAITLTSNLDGTNTLADLNTSAVMDDDFCFQGNTSAVATDHSAFTLASATTIGAATAGTGASYDMNIGGATLTVSANKLRLGTYVPTGPNSDADKVIDYTIQMTSAATTGGEGHVDTRGAYGSSCDSSPYSLKIVITDTDKYQQAGDYTMVSANTVVLSDHTNE